MKNINPDNQKTVMQFITAQHIERSDFIKFFNRLKPKE